MNAEFNWWLLIVGLVVGAGLVWLVLLDARRREDEVHARERPVEAAWLSAALTEEGETVSPALADRMLQLHGEYLAIPRGIEPEHASDSGPLSEGARDR